MVQITSNEIFAASCDDINILTENEETELKLALEAEFEELKLSLEKNDAKDEEFPDHDVCYAETKTKIVTFTGKLLDLSFLVQIWKMKNGWYVWTGPASEVPILGNLFVALPTRLQSFPLATEIFGAEDSTGRQMAQRLSKRTNEQVFVSCQLQEDPQLRAYVEKQIINKIITLQSPTD